MSLMSAYQNMECLENVGRGYDHAAVTEANNTFYNKCEEMDITVAQGRTLGWMVISNFDTIKVLEDNADVECEVGVDDKIDTKHAKFIENIEESLHQGLDGWTDDEQATILAYLKDITKACVAGDK